VYFCPERHGTYFGSFYLKDAPAVGSPGYSIPTTMTGEMGAAFVAALDPTQSARITGLVDAQRADLAGIVEARRAVATELRKFRVGGVADKAVVTGLMTAYGERDGALAYLYATAFCDTSKTLSQAQRDQFAEFRRLMIGSLEPAGAFLYSQPIAMPEIPNTDFLFEDAAAPGPVTAFSAKRGSKQATLSWTNPSTDYAVTRILRTTTTGFATSPTPTGKQVQVYEGTGNSFANTGLTNGTTYRYTAFVRDPSGNWSVPATASVTPKGVSVIGTPVVPSTMYRWKTYRVYGSLRPRHPSGSIVGTIQCERYYRGAWHGVKSYTVRASDYSTYSRYAAKSVRLSTPGKWRIRAYHPATLRFAGDYSPWRYVTVK
jgi:hypothetical protein